MTEIWANLNPVILQNGFKKTGIYPFSRHAISKDKFDPLALAQWEKEHALNHAENNKDKYVNLFSAPKVESNVETYDETQCDCTNQIVENQVYVKVATLLSLTLQFFNKSQFNKSLEDIRCNKNCTEVTENQVETENEGDQFEVEIVESMIEQEINEGKMSIAEKKEEINAMKEEKKLQRVYPLKRPLGL